MSEAPTMTSRQPLPLRPRVVAVIPARGGSKGIVRKNLAPMGGVPLIAHTIRAALACGCFDRVVVSTDDPHIATAARDHGAEAPFLRPPELATDEALLGPVLQHCLGALADAGYHPAVAAMLYPSHPFRPPGLLEECVYRNLQGHNPVVTGRTTAGGHVVTTGLYEGILPGAVVGHGYLVLCNHPAARVDVDTPLDLRAAEEMLRRGLAPAQQAVP